MVQLFRILALVVVLALTLPIADGLAAEGGAAAGELVAHAAPHLPGTELGLVWVVPFVGILLSIALGPLLVPHFWHHHFGKISAGWALAFLVPFTIFHGPDVALYELVHTALLEYFPFIILLLALFTVTGGLRVIANFVGTPRFNTGLLAFGTALASWTGTTGAAMLLIRPLLRANAWRRSRTHVFVFFIFLVANIGGSLTPLGDPPLFLGFLKGVPFFWPTTHLFVPMLFCAVILLAIFFVLDTIMLRRDGIAAPVRPEGEKMRLEGLLNVPLLLGVVASVLMSGVWDPGVSFEIYHVEIELQNLVRDLLLLGLAFLSWRFTARQTRIENEFSWFPIVEVAKLFAGIFITIIPAIAILRSGVDGALASVHHAVAGPDGQPFDVAYFWLTGILSSFLDNAPTYLVFFNTAGGDAELLTTTLASTLVAISCGAVFMGANSYIGNAPNFMVRAIAEEGGVRMPSFFGYTVWALIFLCPIFVLLTLIFFV